MLSTLRSLLSERTQNFTRRQTDYRRRSVFQERPFRLCIDAWLDIGRDFNVVGTTPDSACIARIRG
jgi:hypothetical protein